MSSNNAVIEQVTAMASAYGDVATRVGELERKFTRLPEDGSVYSSVQSMGERLVASPGFAALNGGRSRGTASVELAAITSADTTVGTGRSSSTSLVQADRVAGIVTPPERKMTVRDLIAAGRTTSNSVEHVREISFSNNAASVAETLTKPYSDISFNLVSSPVRTLAHLFKISVQMIADGPALLSYIDTRGRYGIKDYEDRQLLFGSGTGQQLLGLVPQATAFSAALRKTGDTKIDTVRKAMLQVRKSFYRANGVVMSPDDWADIELLRDAGNNYVISDPTINNGKNLWGISVVESDAMPVNSFLCGAFDLAAQIFDRQEVTVELSTENADDFEKNLATVRIEERLTLATYRPLSFVTGTFTV